MFLMICSGRSRGASLRAELTEDQALVEIGESLAAIGGQPRQAALAYALARFVDETYEPRRHR